jgi:hypothetical protein
MLNVHHNHDASDRTALHPAHYRDWRQRNEDIIDEIRSDLAAGLEIKRIFRSIQQFHLGAVIVYEDICNLVQQRAAFGFGKAGVDDYTGNDLRARRRPGISVSIYC